MNLRKVGFIRKKNEEPQEKPGIEFRKAPYYDEEGILRYLRSGVFVAAHMCHEHDIFHPERPEIYHGHYVLTDGDWLWPGYLIYYVQRYRLALPEDFPEHVRENSYERPKESSLDMDAIYDAFEQMSLP